MTQTKRCPHCGGVVAPARRGDTVDTALDRHIELSHTTASKAKEKS